MNERITPYQLFASIFLVPYGSAVLFFLAAEAKQDAWFAILVYIIPALVLQKIYVSLFNLNSGGSIVEYMPNILGKFLGTIISIIYVLYFTYIASRVLRDFTGLIAISTLRGVPETFISTALLLTVAYGVYTGIECLCRAAGIFLPSMMIILFIILVLYYFTPNIINLENIQPILEKGVISPVIASWRLITFPYGETVIFTMIYPNVNKPEKILKAAYSAVILEGIVLAMLNVSFILGLGLNFAEMEYFPLEDALRFVRLGGFIDRLDILIVVALVVDGFIKMSFFMYMALEGASKLFNMKNKKNLVYIFFSIILILSRVIAENFPQHLNIGFNFVVKYIHLPLQIGVPVLALIIGAFSRNKKVENHLTNDNEKQ